jgi:hypothetical protein
MTGWSRTRAARRFSPSDRLTDTRTACEREIPSNLPSIRMLGNLTPRAAARSARGQQNLVAWLKHLENRSSQASTRTIRWRPTTSNGSGGSGKSSTATAETGPWPASQSLSLPAGKPHLQDRGRPVRCPGLPQLWIGRFHIIPYTLKNISRHTICSSNNSSCVVQYFYVTLRRR